jgi:hypothetical protein
VSDYFGLARKVRLIEFETGYIICNCTSWATETATWCQHDLVLVWITGTFDWVSKPTLHELPLAKLTSRLSAYLELLAVAGES